MSDIYWSNREVEQFYNLRMLDYERELAKEYRRCLKITKRNLEALYDKIKASSADGTLLANDLYKYNRYYELMNTLNQEMTKLGNKEIELLDANLVSMYEFTYGEVGKAINFSSNFNLSAARNAVEAIWCSDGKHWSDRIWRDKQALQQLIQDGLIDCVSRGASKSELVKQLQKDMNTTFYRADRIARTELTYVYNKATYDKFAEAGIEKYKYLAADDARTSDLCKEMNGKVFYLKDAQVGLNYPPLHPFCRSTVLAVI